MTITDCHTHREALHAVVNVPSHNFAPTDGIFYSMGIHPWEAGEADEVLWNRFVDAASSPRVVALGETGLDARRGPSLDVQRRWFERHVALSETLGKPLIIHCVGAFHVLLAMRSGLRPRQPWLVHGFRGKPTLGRQLLDAGLYVSLGFRFNEETARMVPDDRLLIETDDSGLAITDVAARLAAARRVPVASLLAQATTAATALFV